MRRTGDINNVSVCIHPMITITICSIGIVVFNAGVMDSLLLQLLAYLRRSPRRRLLENAWETALAIWRR